MNPTYHNTMRGEFEDILRLIHAFFHNRIRGVHPSSEPSAWSEVYCVTLLDGKRVFLKGTPRSRGEAYITQQLHALCPANIPRVIVADISSATPWRWFLLEDGGSSPHEGLPTAYALKAAYALGALQRRAMKEPTLAASLVPCEGARLQEHALDVCGWAINLVPPEPREQLLRIASHLARARIFFQEVASRLSVVPPTCVHGDLWPGNIAVTDLSVRLLDWGDTLWGVGGVSIVNLLSTAQATLAAAEPQVWDAYGEGLKRKIRPDYKEACTVARMVSSVVVDRAIAHCCGRGIAILPGLIPELQRLAERASSRPFS